MKGADRRFLSQVSAREREELGSAWTRDRFSIAATTA
jgi:hypothetical protein